MHTLESSKAKIKIYGREHGVPHFHIEGPDFRGSVSIETLELLIGRMPRRVLKEAIDWAKNHKTELL